MTINRLMITTLSVTTLAAPLVVAAQHQHMPAMGQPPAQATPPDMKVAPKGEKAIKVGKKGDVSFSAETLVGDLRLKPGRYEIQHRVDGADHFVHFTEMSKRLPYGQAGGTTAVAHPGDAACRLEKLDHAVSGTSIYTREEGGSVRITRVLIHGENVAHLF